MLRPQSFAVHRIEYNNPQIAACTKCAITNLDFTVKGGIVMLFNAVQLNALVPIICSPSLNVTYLKFLQILQMY